MLDEIIGEFIGGALELICKSKIKKESMPDIPYQKSFTVQFKRGEILLKVILSLGCMILLVLAIAFFNMEMLMILLGVTLLTLSTLLFTLDAISYRCYVTEASMHQQKFWLIRKTVKWDTVAYIQQDEDLEDSSKAYFSLCNADGRPLISFSTRAKNAWHVIRMANAKNIETKTAE